MLKRATNRLRPTLDALEAREVCFAGLSLGIPVPVIGPLPTIAPVNPIVHVSTPRLESAKNPIGRGSEAKPAPELNQVDSVITLRNETSTTIRFNVRWVGSREVSRYILAPGASQRVTFRQVELVRPNLTATIQYASDMRGSVVRRAQVASGLAAVGDDGSSHGEGRVYAFQPTGSGVRLISVPQNNTDK